MGKVKWCMCRGLGSSGDVEIRDTEFLKYTHFEFNDS